MFAEPINDPPKLLARNTFSIEKSCSVIMMNIVIAILHLVPFPHPILKFSSKVSRPGGPAAPGLQSLPSVLSRKRQSWREAPEAWQGLNLSAPASLGRGGGEGSLPRD